ncbi:MAG: hypothetical protein COU40_00135 [Candidatus Moranbacteria bacterium CG10_big_fil_rev_8_21_14_0_10_35_21]|nr:MAG: hypothetical protein COU40_00135 [Candidatus Moranbacteria bacterium CG10_big_fil_rev_8_21_14_0_10_35_21]PJA88465.1 MAG: hypothetical protein CO139_03100 [Candidatus Moranbacteria bacterium CG_4_9_14_3_um_filter_36_9]
MLEKNNFLNKLKASFLDTLFPINCVSCGKYGKWICDPCLKGLPSLPYQLCFHCERIITESGSLCQNCLKKSRKNKETFPKINTLIVAISYKEKLPPRLIHLFKYKFISDLQFPLGEILKKSLEKSRLPLPDIILPVPLHRIRLRARGFNQSGLLAEYIGKNLAPGLSLPVLPDILKRMHHTLPQMSIKKYQDRKKNVQNIFTITTNSKVKGKNILLIDDVATTGATLFECARILKQNGAKKVFGAVLARQSFKKIY